MARNLSIGCYRYETTEALFTGAVGFDGHDAVVEGASFIPEIFRRMVVERAYDAAELGLGFLLRSLQLPDAPFVAVPAFPNRVFRHSCVYVHVDAGIDRPEDLHDRTIGEFALYGQDSGVWAKGILSDEYGFRPETNRWVIGGLNDPMAPFDFVPQHLPEHLDVRAEPERALNDLLERGEIDALFSSNVPRCVLDASPHVRRLFDDYVTVERDHYRRTGLFPIMHTVVVRRDLLEARPELARVVHQGFLDAKNAARDRYLAPGRLLYQVPTMVPWMSRLVEDDLALMGEDWWPYGVEANRAALETFLRYFHEQGLSERRHTVEELFPAELLGT